MKVMSSIYNENSISCMKYYTLDIILSRSRDLHQPFRSTRIHCKKNNSVILNVDKYERNVLNVAFQREVKEKHKSCSYGYGF